MRLTPPLYNGHSARSIPPLCARVNFEEEQRRKKEAYLLHPYAAPHIDEWLCRMPQFASLLAHYLPFPPAGKPPAVALSFFSPFVSFFKALAQSTPGVINEIDPKNGNYPIHITAQNGKHFAVFSLNPPPPAASVRYEASFFDVGIQMFVIQQHAGCRASVTTLTRALVSTYDGLI